MQQASAASPTQAVTKYPLLLYGVSSILHTANRSWTVVFASMWA